MFIKLKGRGQGCRASEKKKKVEVTLNTNTALKGIHLHCVDVSLDAKYCPITPVENMK
jgi:hypothetical protein